MAIRSWGQYIIQATIPSEDPVVVGSLWYDTTALALKVCTGVAPYAFATTTITVVHDLLSATHPDVTAASVARGALVTGQGASPKWTLLAKGSAGQVLRSDGTDLAWATLTAIAHDFLSATHGDVTAAAVSRGALVTGQGASPKWTILGIGSANKVLKSDGTEATWGNLDTANLPASGVSAGTTGGTEIIPVVTVDATGRLTSVTTAIPLAYASGTWVPVITLAAGGAPVVPVYTVNSGTYTRLGRLCFFNVELSGDGGAEGAGSGIMSISLPFATSASQLKIRIPAGTAINGANEHLVWIELAAGVQSTATLYHDSIVAVDLEQIPFTGADQNNTNRVLNLQGKLLV